MFSSALHPRLLRKKYYFYYLDMQLLYWIMFFKGKNIIHK
jgi:hypothetical protein